ncbi:MAG: FmdB family transcriptional regulator [Acidobacteria bacterium]|nr:FmdB family transcriptional regulator [Acidobacteriota bacterium]
MPVYQYRCADCGHELEVQQAFTDDALTECPACHGALKKRFGSVGISFKGSGFYKNDSRGSGSSSSSSSGSSSDTTSSSSDTSSSSTTGSTTASSATSAAPAAAAASGSSTD